MESAAAEALTAADNQLRLTLFRLQSSACENVAFTDLATVRAQLVLTMETLRGAFLGALAEPRLRGQAAIYRDRLEQLQQILPMVQTKLLVERNRLRGARQHAQGLASWVEANRSAR